MPTTPIKRRIRAETIAAILGLDEAARAAQGARLREIVVASPSYRAARTVLLYMKAFPEEVDVVPLIARALGDGKRVACPRVDRAHHRLILQEIRDPAVDFRPGVLNIPEPRPDAPVVEPSEVDWALAPGVAFDAGCNRVGRGAGHYDRLLPQLRDDVEVWAVAFDPQIRDDLPVEPHDVPLDVVATPTRLFSRRHFASPQDTSGAFA